jgi:Uncharacterised protein family (UPF0236)
MDREVLHRVKARLDGLVEELLGSAEAPRTIDEVEAAALKLREKAGQLVAEELAQAAAERAQREEGDPKKVACACGRWARNRGGRERDVVLLTGRMRVCRSYYYCRRCDQGFCLTDRALGLYGGPFTRRVVQEVVRLDALLPYQKAVGLLGELSGVWVSAKEAQRMLERAGVLVESYQAGRWGQAAQEGLAGKAAPDVLYLLADGVQTPILGGWRETKIGVARGMDASGRKLGESRYVSLLGESEAFGWEWAALAEGAGIAHARLVAVLGDGAKWIWNQAELHFPQAIQIVDVWHATERLWEVGRLAFGAEEANLKAWVKARQAELWEYETDALLEALADVVQRFEAAKEKAQEAIGYFTNNRQRMDYPRYQRLGLQVGSGAVESACKQVVTQRLKGAGMRWREAGAQTMARLRCLLLGDEWHAFVRHWNQVAAPMAI